MGNYRFETLALHVGQETPDPASSIGTEHIDDILEDISQALDASTH